MLLLLNFMQFFTLIF